jgi:hypothetical protein
VLSSLHSRHLCSDSRLRFAQRAKRGETSKGKHEQLWVRHLVCPGLVMGMEAPELHGMPYYCALSKLKACAAGRTGLACYGSQELKALVGPK